MDFHKKNEVEKVLEKIIKFPNFFEDINIQIQEEQ